MSSGEEGIGMPGKRGQDAVEEDTWNFRDEVTGQLLYEVSQKRGKGGREYMNSVE